LNVVTGVFCAQLCHHLNSAQAECTILGTVTWLLSGFTEIPTGTGNIR